MHNTKQDEDYLSQKKTLSKFATALKSKDLLNEFIKENSITEKATALIGVCDMVGFKSGKNELIKM